MFTVSIYYGTEINKYAGMELPVIQNIPFPFVHVAIFTVQEI